MKGINSLTEEELRQALTRCCGASEWVERMTGQRPFSSPEDLHTKAQTIYASLETADFLDAFAHHPQIGSNLNKLREKFATTADWSSNEQGAVKQASEKVLQQLAAGNEAYFDRFGYIFIVCATGKSAQEMLDLLEARLPNDPADEIKIAAGEQEKIMAIRLDKLLEEFGQEWLFHVDKAHQFSISFPEFSSTGQSVTIEKNQNEAFHRIHVFSKADMQEIYFEVRSYSAPLKHHEDIEYMKLFLKEHSPEGKISAPSNVTLHSLQATEFKFEGDLQGFYKVRRFVYVDTHDQTYRIVYDPRSQTNEQILESLNLNV